MRRSARRRAFHGARRHSRVCLVTDSLAPSGVGQHMLALAECLRDRYDVVLACPLSPGGRRLLEEADRVGVATRMVDLADERELEVWLATFDVVHVHAGITFEGLHLVRLARSAGVAAVVRTEHQPYVVESSEQAERYRTAVDSVDRVVCVSQGVEDSFLQAGVPPRKVVVVRNGVAPVELADAVQVRHRLGLPDAAPVVLTPARFTERKGHRYLLEAARALVRGRRDVRLVWSGAGPLRSPPVLIRTVWASDHPREGALVRVTSPRAIHRF